jgi:signal transduction histidine kinase
MAAAIGDRSEGLAKTQTLEGDPVYSAFVRIPDTRWVVTVALTRDEVEGPLRRLLAFTLGSGLAFFLAAAAISIFLARRMIAPIGQLADAARGIASGKTFDVPAHRYAREIATLAEALQAASEGTRERQQMSREFAFRLQRDVEDERRRIARSFHDDLGQRLTLIAMSAEIVRGKTADPEHHRLLDGLSEAVRAAVTSMRRIIAGIRPPETDLGIVPALTALLDGWSERTGVASILAAEGEFTDLPEPMLVALYRIVQETLNNAGKHASATKVDVALRRAGAEVSLEIRDDGIGMDVDAERRKPGHFGLFGIGERAAQFGGTSRVSSAPGGGTIIAVVLPLPAHAGQPGDRDVWGGETRA